MLYCLWMMTGPIDESFYNQVEDEILDRIYTPGNGMLPSKIGEGLTPVCCLWLIFFQCVFELIVIISKIISSFGVQDPISPISSLFCCFLLCTMPFHWLSSVLDISYYITYHWLVLGIYMVTSSGLCPVHQLILTLVCGMPSSSWLKG